MLSILTTTGFASVDFQLWTDQAKMAHFGDLHPLSRIALTLAMWIGRLEVLTVLVVLRREVWRTGQWSVERNLAS